MLPQRSMATERVICRAAEEAGKRSRLRGTTTQTSYKIFIALRSPAETQRGALLLTMGVN